MPKRRSHPLRDLSNGKLKGWPGGSTHYPDGMVVPGFRPAEPDENHDESGIRIPEVRPAPTEWGKKTWCKYCTRDRPPLALHEFVIGETRMMICAECGAGLTPPEKI